MKKKILAVVLLSTLVAPAFAVVDHPWYAGVSIGSTSISGLNSATSIGGLVGYKLNDMFAIEGQATLLGSYDLATYTDTSGSLTATESYTSVGVDAIAMQPVESISKDLSVFAKLGYLSNTGSVTCSGTGIYTGTSCSGLFPVVSNSGIDYGFGAQYSATPNIGIRAGYQSYNSIINSSITNIYVAGIYSFK